MTPQDPGSLDPLASALARASGSQRGLDQVGRRGSNTSIVSQAGSTASSMLHHPTTTHSQSQISHISAPVGGLSARGSYDNPSSPHSAVPSSAAQMSHPYGSPGGSERGAVQYLGAAAPGQAGPPADASLQVRQWPSLLHLFAHLALEAQGGPSALKPVLL